MANNKRLLLELLSSESEEEEEFMINILSYKRIWLSPYVQERDTCGEFHTLLRKLTDEQFQNYFRVSKSTFFKIHEIICNDITKQDTNFRKAIGTFEKLATCLR